MSDVLDRFWAKVEVRGPDECWTWTAGRTAQGYGGFHPTKPTMELAHRYVYKLYFGELEMGLKVDHTCHNGKGCPPGPCEHRLCCNPSHLEAVSNSVNVNRSHNSNFQKTHCPKGHEYTDENTRLHIKPNTIGRSCKECARMRDRQPHRNASIRRKRYALQKAA